MYTTELQSQTAGFTSRQLTLGENIVRYFIHIGLERLRACLGLCWGIKLLKSKRVFYKKLNFKFFSEVCLGPFLE
jgi:hypothetical protein